MIGVPASNYLPGMLSIYEMLLELCPSGRIFLTEAEILALEGQLLLKVLPSPLPGYAIVPLNFVNFISW